MTDRAKQDAWCRVLRSAASARRADLLVALDALVEEQEARTRSEREVLARQIGQAYLDPLGPRAERPPELRHPVLFGFLAPTFAEMAEHGQEHAHRWLAITLALIQQAGGQTPPGLPDPWGTFRIAVAADESDTASRRWLLDHLGDDLEFAVHEVPSGVLADRSEILEEAREVEALARDLDEVALWSDRLALWRFHADAYSDYLSQRDQYVSYEQYLDENPEPGPRA